MASAISKAPLLRAAASRGYSQLAPVSGYPNYDVKTTVLPNNLVAVTADNKSSIARVSVTVRAGSRNETSENLGVSHVLRICAGLSTKNASQFAITRNIQQLGANLTATSDRETISYTLEGTPKAVESAIPYLIEVATQQVFHPWEVSDQSDRLKLELAVRPLQLRAIDLLHKAAFRTGLGNSLFVPKFQIGKISTEALQHFVNCTFTTSRAAVVGLGLSDTDVIKIAQSLKLKDSSTSNTPPSPYKGGELRSDKGGDFAFVAIAGEGASIKNTKEALACAVLQRVLGTGPQIPFASLDNGVLNKSIAGCSDRYSATAINASYSDTGLVGVLLAVPTDDAGRLVEGAVKVLKSGNITDADVQRGKNQLKASLLLERESGSKTVNSLGVQAVLTGAAQSSAELADLVDKVSVNDVKQALQKAGKKLSIASVGNLSKVPYADDLK